jgi:nitrite reductase/ring-hydroxylating ferredoxin subunit
MSHDIYAKSDPTLEAGAARCPGPSAQDIIARDSGETPAPLRSEAYQFLGDDDLSIERYTSQAFYDLEMEKMWRKTWQWACREESIPNKGDYQTYDIGDWSVIVIRGEDAKIRAFANSCPHRAMQFCKSGESGTGKQFIRCPFHGMSWHLDGSLREIPCRWDFPHIEDENFRLSEVACDAWGGFVFINLDADAQPLDDYLIGHWISATPYYIPRKFCRAIGKCAWKVLWKHSMCLQPTLKVYVLPVGQIRSTIVLAPIFQDSYRIFLLVTRTLRRTYLKPNCISS